VVGGVNVLSITHVLPTLSRTFHGVNENRHVIPQTSAVSSAVYDG
jgi:hypothetical protein